MRAAQREVATHRVVVVEREGFGRPPSMSVVIEAHGHSWDVDVDPELSLGRQLASTRCPGCRVRLGDLR